MSPATRPFEPSDPSDPVPFAPDRSGSTAGARTTPRLALTRVTKRYPGVLANDAVSLEVAPGEIHGLIGENGAGKSTLMRIVYGMTRPDSGEIAWEGQAIEVASPAHARRLGIGMVFQHFSLFETLTVVENIALALPEKAGKAGGAGRGGQAELAEQIGQIGQRYGLEVDPYRRVHTLSLGQCQRVEILRCLLQQPRLLILDEPTSVLTPQAVAGLFVTLRQLAEEGCSVLYISHKLEEVRTLCRRATVLRAGRVTGVCDPAAETVGSLSRLMIGAEPPRAPRGDATAGEPLLEVIDLSMPPADPTGRALHGVSLAVRSGEIIGLAGVSGNGQNELLDLIVGEDPRSPAGAIRLAGKPVGQSGVACRRAQGLAFVPSERLGRGAVPALGLHLNTLLTRDGPPWVRHGLIHPGALTELSARIIERFGVRATGPRALAQSLSGGNLQKFIVGREVLREPRVLVVAHPTWGVDVGAAARIRAELAALRDAGSAVLVVSEELDELFELCDAIHVLTDGRVSPRLPVGELTVETLGRWMGAAGSADAGADPALRSGGSLAAAAPV